MKFFRGASEANRETQTFPKLTRRSNGLVEVSRRLDTDEQLCVLDIGSTSAANIRYLTERNHRIYSEDLLEASTDPALETQDEDGKRTLDSKRFLADNLTYPNGHFDVVLCWNLADYLDESLVKPVVARLWSTMKSGGVLLAFFHMQEAGPDAPCYRYHIVDKDKLEMQHIVSRKDVRKGPTGAHRPPDKTFRLQRVFNNRHIENLFRDFGSIKFFLTRDNIREVLVVR
jgi:SAM-dependent methyltransferase